MAAISYQLFSSRNFDVDDTLAMIAGLGITDVEGYGPYYDDPAATAAKLKKHGLSMPTAHCSIDLVESTPDRAIEVAKTIGIKSIIVPYLMPDARPTDAAGWADFGKRLAAAGKKMVDAGFEFGWHNHDFEFLPLNDGSYAIDHILAGGDHVNLELDLAWVHVAGLDPIATLEKYKSRIIAVHVKDRAPKGTADDEGGWADLGHGEMNWTGIAAKLRELGVKRYVLEHDNPKDHVRFATRSVATVKTF